MKTLLLRCLVLAWALVLLAWPAATVWAGENPAVPATTPTADFTLDDVNGTAYHTKTGLTWKRCAEGQTWGSGNCTGAATTYTWSMALRRGLTLGTFATFNDWRLPNFKELGSIVERRNSSPVINATVFPNTPSYYFWSASPYAPDAGLAWGVGFGYGDDVAGSKGYGNAVRLVRGGQYALLSVTKTGGGSGTVASSLPGVDCGPYCQGSFAHEMFTAEQVVLTATPDANSTFGSWTNCPSANGNQCTVNTAVDQTVTATFKANQTIGAITFNPATLAVGGVTTASATGGASGNPVTFTSTTTGVCTVSGTNGVTVTGVTAGTCTIAANQAGNANYNAATQVTQSLTVGKANQTISGFTFTPTMLAIGGTTTASATGGGSGNPVTFTSTTTGVCTVSGTNNEMVTGVAAGPCTIAANQEGNANYNAATQVTQSLTVNKIAADVSLSANPSAPAVNQPVTITATVTAPSAGLGTPSGTVVISGGGQSCTATLSSGSGSCALTYASAGEVALTGNYSGDSAFNPAHGDLTISIGKLATTTALTSAPNPSAPGQPFTLTATVSTASGSPTGTVAFQHGGDPIPACNAVALTGQTATCATSMSLTRSHIFTAQYSGNSTYAASQGTVTQTVNGLEPVTMTTPGLPNAVVGIPYAVTLGASGGQPPYAYTGTGLPAGLTLNAAGVVSGIPTTPGPASVAITVTDTAGQTGQRTYAMTVETVVAVVTPSLINGLQSAAYAQTLQAVGGQLPYAWSLLTGTLPAGLVLDPASGLISGTPMTLGTATFTVQVIDHAGQRATQALTLTIQALFTRPDPVHPGSAPIRVGLTVNPEAGPTCALDDANTFTLNLGQNGVPVAGPPGVQFPNGLFQVRITGCTPGDTTLTLTLVYPQPLPAGTQVWKYGPTAADPTAHWYVMPGAILQGNTVTYTVRDGGLGDDDLLANGTITDPAGPGVPALNLSGTLPTTGQVGVAYSGTLTATAGSGGPYVWSVVAGTLPAGLALATPAAATSTVSGTPTQAGTAAFTVQVVDQGNGNTAAQQAFTVQITGVSPPLRYTVTPSAGAGGTLQPATAQTVASGATTTFTVSATPGYAIASVTGCNGTLAGTTYTTGPISADCTVSASFRANPPGQARVDALLFPYVVISDTLSSIVSVIHQVDAAPGAMPPSTLHYTLYAKQGDAGLDPTTPCTAVEMRHPTSPNDVVSIDLGGGFGDSQGVLFEPADQQRWARYAEVPGSLALGAARRPARGFLLVDNHDAPIPAREGSLAGEVIIIDFLHGAAWGYAGYNADPVTDLAGADPADSLYAFEDANESAGEVLAGRRDLSLTRLTGGVSPPRPIALMPLTGITTRLFVTPIGHAVTFPAATVAHPPLSTGQTLVGPRHQQRGDLSTELRIGDDAGGTAPPVVYDRDENPIPGAIPQLVTCVGAVDIDALLSQSARNQIGASGGWTPLAVGAPGPLVTLSGDPNRPTATRTTHTNQAIVIKLEFNAQGLLNGQALPGAFNNAIWQRQGIRESVPRTTTVPAFGDWPYLMLRSVLDDQQRPISVGEDFIGDRLEWIR